MIRFPLRPDERLARIDWPPLTEVHRPTLSDGDVVVICGGFEDRAVESFRRLCAPPTPDVSVVLVEYSPPYVENRSQELRQLASGAGLAVSHVPYDRQNPAGIGEAIAAQVVPPTHVCLDVSGMSRLLIVQTLVELLRKPLLTVSVVYGEARTYPPSESKFVADSRTAERRSLVSYLSSGVFEIAVAPELSSVAMLGEAIRLVAFPSFDPLQLANVLDELQPAYTDVIHGLPPSEENSWRRDAIENLNGPVLKETSRRADYEASTLDYTETLRVVGKIYADRNAFDRIVIAPTGSKMQAVAVGLFRAAVRDVQIVYPTPRTFVDPTEYTIGMKRLYQLDVPSAAISTVLDGT